MNIPFFDYPALFREHEEEFVKIFRDVGSRGAYILQQELSDFEKNLAQFMGVKHAIGVANGTDALIIALRAAGIKPGDEIILPSHTYIASAAAIHYVGATAVLADIGYDNMLDPVHAEKLVTSATRAIMPVQINGRICDMDAIQAIAERHNLIIVEDAAQALGARFNGKSAGSFGAAATISFYPAKLLGCFGDGGAVVTNDDEVAKQVLLLRDHGRDEDGVVVSWGLNSRLDNLQAAFLDHKLKSYENDIARRREIAGMYTDGLQGLNSISLPQAPDAKAMHFDVFQNFELEADNRDELQAFLGERGVRTIVQWAGTPIHQFKELGFEADLPRTNSFFERCLMLPMNVTLSDDQVRYICDTIQEFYKNEQA